jgi:hypothetical protein
MRWFQSIAISLAVLLLPVGYADAQQSPLTTPRTPVRVEQRWTAGWDLSLEPLDFTHSNIVWSLNPATKTLTVSFLLVHANPNKLYQMSAHFFCTTFPATFGQFPNDTVGGGACGSITRQGVTRTVTAVEFGVVRTDIDGNGTFDVDIGPIASGVYSLEFTARNGAGCNVNGGGGNGPTICNADFQSPGPIFGNAVTITVP